MARRLAQQDVVVTGGHPGAKAPVLITEEMVTDGQGGVIVDLAAERGGNCELTKPAKRSARPCGTLVATTNIARQPASPCQPDGMAATWRTCCAICWTRRRLALIRGRDPRRR
ncbi:hypothetical protein DSL92_03670 [Billgrantia gudaonensis]|uniref:proton-translocating NAD(P)(+) transhydrogenase n=1 Tax=Billgrantia gudaonensis TaxID=376427 RepID=A0A432JKT0_9GAMM|nr:hypothetical protein DSL92_03670 [Halomonas gudaonensis]